MWAKHLVVDNKEHVRQHHRNKHTRYTGTSAGSNSRSRSQNPAYQIIILRVVSDSMKGQVMGYAEIAGEAHEENKQRMQHRQGRVEIDFYFSWKRSRFGIFEGLVCFCSCLLLCDGYLHTATLTVEGLRDARNIARMASLGAHNSKGTHRRMKYPFETIDQ